MKRYSCPLAILSLVVSATLLAQTSPSSETLNGYGITFTHVVTGKLTDGSFFKFRG
ncbi:MAG TPA: hypothetical protein VGL91_16515 [Acidobacteriota bacterium]